MVLDHLVLHNAHAGFGHRGLRQRNPGLVGGCGCGEENAVHLLLRVRRIECLGFFDAEDLLLELSTESING